jgi:hypothetical protein
VLFDKLAPQKASRQGVKAMLDVIFVGLTLVLFGLMAAYAFGCDKL